MTNYIDLAVIIYLFLLFASGAHKSSRNTFIDLIGLILSIYVGIMTYKYTSDIFAGYFFLGRGYANVIGFFANTIIFKYIYFFVIDDILKLSIINPDPKPNPLKILLSGMLSAVYGLTTIIIMFAVIFSFSLPVYITDAMKGSVIASASEKDPLGINKRYRQIFEGIYPEVLQDFNFLSIKTGGNELIDLGFKTTETEIDSEAETKMLDLVNNERISRGLKPLKMDEDARQAARDYGRYLFQNGVFSHVDLESKGPDDRMKRYETNFYLIGENLAYAHNLDEAHKGLMESPEHRDNILHPLFSRIGIGVINAGNHGMIFVQEFLN
jgi:hypothetical protein